MSIIDWIALIIAVLFVAVVAWALLILLWFVGMIANRIASGSWGIRQHLVRWVVLSAILAFSASFSGFYVCDLPAPIIGADDDELMTYKSSVIEKSLEHVIYALALMLVHVVWMYVNLAYGLIAGKHQVDAEADIS